MLESFPLRFHFVCEEVFFSCGGIFKNLSTSLQVGQPRYRFATFYPLAVFPGGIPRSGIYIYGYFIYNHGPLGQWGNFTADSPALNGKHLVQADLLTPSPDIQWLTPFHLQCHSLLSKIIVKLSVVNCEFAKAHQTLKQALPPPHKYTSCRTGTAGLKQNFMKIISPIPILPADLAELYHRISTWHPHCEIWMHTTFWKFVTSNQYLWTRSALEFKLYIELIKSAIDTMAGLKITKVSDMEPSIGDNDWKAIWLSKPTQSVSAYTG